MSHSDVTLIDYGMGNVWSVRSAFRYLGCNVAISDNPDEIRAAKTLLLPGVGSFRKAMQALRKKNLDQAIVDSVQNNGTKILGICLGMQLMGTSSTEDGDTQGLGLIPKSVERFTAEEIGENKIPHIGFNSVHSETGAELFQDLSQDSDFYFVHSYRMLSGGIDGKLATCKFGGDFLAAYENKNVFATQFHPEKSQTNGLVLLRNFLDVGSC